MIADGEDVDLRAILAARAARRAGTASPDGLGKAIADRAARRNSDLLGGLNEYTAAQGDLAGNANALMENPDGVTPAGGNAFSEAGLLTKPGAVGAAAETTDSTLRRARAIYAGPTFDDIESNQREWEKVRGQPGAPDAREIQYRSWQAIKRAMSASERLHKSKYGSKDKPDYSKALEARFSPESLAGVDVTDKEIAPRLLGAQVTPWLPKGEPDPKESARAREEVAREKIAKLMIPGLHRGPITKEEAAETYYELVRAREASRVAKWKDESPVLGPLSESPKLVYMLGAAGLAKAAGGAIAAAVPAAEITSPLAAQMAAMTAGDLGVQGIERATGARDSIDFGQAATQGIAAGAGNVVGGLVPKAVGAVLGDVAAAHKVVGMLAGGADLATFNEASSLLTRLQGHEAAAEKDPKTREVVRTAIAVLLGAVMHAGGKGEAADTSRPMSRAETAAQQAEIAKGYERLAGRPIEVPDATRDQMLVEERLKNQIAAEADHASPEDIQAHLRGQKTDYGERVRLAEDVRRVAAERQASEQETAASRARWDAEKARYEEAKAAGLRLQAERENAAAKAADEAKAAERAAKAEAPRLKRAIADISKDIAESKTDGNRRYLGTEEAIHQYGDAHDLSMDSRRKLLEHSRRVLGERDAAEASRAELPTATPLERAKAAYREDMAAEQRDADRDALASKKYRDLYIDQFNVPLNQRAQFHAFAKGEHVRGPDMARKPEPVRTEPLPVPKPAPKAEPLPKAAKPAPATKPPKADPETRQITPQEKAEIEPLATMLARASANAARSGDKQAEKTASEMLSKVSGYIHSGKVGDDIEVIRGAAEVAVQMEQAANRAGKGGEQDYREAQHGLVEGIAEALARRDRRIGAQVEADRRSQGKTPGEYLTASRAATLIGEGTDHVITSAGQQRFVSAEEARSLAKEILAGGRVVESVHAPSDSVAATVRLANGDSIRVLPPSAEGNEAETWQRVRTAIRKTASQSGAIDLTSPAAEAIDEVVRRETIRNAKDAVFSDAIVPAITRLADALNMPQETRLALKQSAAYWFGINPDTGSRSRTEAAKQAVAPHVEELVSAFGDYSAFLKKFKASRSATLMDATLFKLHEIEDFKAPEKFSASDIAEGMKRLKRITDAAHQIGKLLNKHGLLPDETIAYYEEHGYLHHSMGRAALDSLLNGKVGKGFLSKRAAAKVRGSLMGRKLSGEEFVEAGGTASVMSSYDALMKQLDLVNIHTRLSMLEDAGLVVKPNGKTPHQNPQAEVDHKALVEQKQQLDEMIDLGREALRMVSRKVDGTTGEAHRMAIAEQTFLRAKMDHLLKSRMSVGLAGLVQIPLDARVYGRFAGHWVPKADFAEIKDQIGYASENARLVRALSSIPVNSWVRMKSIGGSAIEMLGNIEHARSSLGGRSILRPALWRDINWARKMLGEVAEGGVPSDPLFQQLMAENAIHGPGVAGFRDMYAGDSAKASAIEAEFERASHRSELLEKAGERSALAMLEKVAAAYNYAWVRGPELALKKMGASEKTARRLSPFRHAERLHLLADQMPRLALIKQMVEQGREVRDAIELVDEFYGHRTMSPIRQLTRAILSFSPFPTNTLKSVFLGSPEYGPNIMGVRLPAGIRHAAVGQMRNPFSAKGKAAIGAWSAGSYASAVLNSTLPFVAAGWAARKITGIGSEEDDKAKAQHFTDHPMLAPWLRMFLIPHGRDATGNIEYWDPTTQHPLTSAAKYFGDLFTTSPGKLLEKNVPAAAITAIHDTYKDDKDMPDDERRNNMRAMGFMIPGVLGNGVEEALTRWRDGGKTGSIPWSESILRGLFQMQFRHLSPSDEDAKVLADKLEGRVGRKSYQTTTDPGDRETRRHLDDALGRFLRTEGGRNYTRNLREKKRQR